MLLKPSHHIQNHYVAPHSFSDAVADLHAMLTSATATTPADLALPLVADPAYSRCYTKEEATTAAHILVYATSVTFSITDLLRPSLLSKETTCPDIPRLSSFDAGAYSVSIAFGDVSLPPVPRRPARRRVQKCLSSVAVAVTVAKGQS